MLAGTLALTAFCAAVACDSAACAVADHCDEPCAWPAPPEPADGPELGSCDWSLCWLVLALLPALLPAPLDAFWVALLAPPFTSPPAMLTGTLALTAFCASRRL